MLTRFLGACWLVASLAAPSAFANARVYASREPGSVAMQQATSAARQLGTIKAIKGSTITLTTDDDGDILVPVQDATRIVRVEPGAKDLKGATALAFKDLQVGDRILVRGQATTDGKTLTPSAIVAMKHEDVEAKRARDREEWQKHGIGGLVRAVDAAAGTVTISVGAGPTAATVTVHTTKDTTVLRYAPDSVKYDDARLSTLGSVKVGDQARARGARSQDGKDLSADEIVSGSFRNIAGTITEVDPAANTIVVTDLMTKQPVTVKIPANSQIKKLPPEVAQRIAMRLKAAADSAPGAGGPPAAGSAGVPGAGSPGQGGAGGQGAQAAAGAGPGGAGGGRPGEGDLQQVLSRMPPAALTDLNKGDAVMICSTEGNASGQVTAITLLAGVEPILTASPRGAQAMMLSPWALGGGGDAGADANP